MASEWKPSMNLFVRLNKISHSAGSTYKKINTLLGHFHCQLYLNASLLRRLQITPERIGLYGNDGFDLEIHAGHITITRHIDARFPLFFSVSPQTSIISNDLFDFPRLQGKSDWDADYFAYYLFKGEAQTRETPLRGVGKLFNGETLSILANGQTRSCCQAALDALWPAEAPGDIEVALRRSVRHHQDGRQPLSLDFSGGLDSTALLLCALDEQIPLQTLTLYDPDGCAPDDHRIACALSAKYRVTHRVIDLACQPPLDLDEPVYAHHPSQQFIGFGAERQILALHDDAACTHLNGHGGDHLFVANPLFESALDLLLQGQFRAFGATLRTLARFYAIPYALAARTILEVWLRHSVRRDVCRPYWANAQSYHWRDWLQAEIAARARAVHSYRHFIGSAARAPGAQMRAALFFQLAQEISHYRLRDIRSKLVYPFFQAGVMRCAFAYSDCATFDQANSRKPMRTALFAKYRESQLWRQSKGHTTSMTLRLLNQSRNAIHELLREGYLVGAGMASWSGIERELRKVCLGIGGLSPCLMHALAIEVFMRQARRNS